MAPAPAGLAAGAPSGLAPLCSLNTHPVRLEFPDAPGAQDALSQSQSRLVSLQGVGSLRTALVCLFWVGDLHVPGQTTLSHAHPRGVCFSPATLRAEVSSEPCQHLAQSGLGKWWSDEW